MRVRRHREGMSIEVPSQEAELATLRKENRRFATLRKLLKGQIIGP